MNNCMHCGPTGSAMNSTNVCVDCNRKHSIEAAQKRSRQDMRNRNRADCKRYDLSEGSTDRVVEKAKALSELQSRFLTKGLI